MSTLSVFKEYTKLVDADLKRFISSFDHSEIYRIMEYFLGFRDQNLNKKKTYSGKRFRPGVTMLLSNYYGLGNAALPAASAIELFHNFSLIHDDIQDNDVMRRGKPTVWKLWGLNEAINVGDAMFALAYLRLTEIDGKDPVVAAKVRKLLYKTFLQVAEGQSLDLRMANISVSDPLVTMDTYNNMIYGKTAVLMGAATMVPGILSGQPEDVCQALWDYGLNLGLAYQYADDLYSIWGSTEETGKVEAKDIAEHKKTLPVIYLFHKLDSKKQLTFSEIYDKKSELTIDEVSEIKNMLSEKAAHDFVWSKMKEKLLASNAAIKKTNLTKEQQAQLLNINKVLIPNMKWWDA